MGLDQYLFKAKIGTNLEADNSEVTKVAYWRKVNFLHDWVEKRKNIIDDWNCKNINLTKDDLSALVKLCELALSDNKLAEMILPTCGGFFFGSTEYDDDYFSQIKETHEIIKTVVSETDFNTYEIYYHEWW